MTSNSIPKVYVNGLSNDVVKYWYSQCLRIFSLSLIIRKPNPAEDSDGN